MNKLNDTLYAKYIKERFNGQVLENESGFIVYFINGDECAIQEMAVNQDQCGKGHGKELIKQLSEIALSQECKFISANVQVWDKGAANTLTAAFKTGFELGRAENNTILIIKKIGGL